MRSVPDEWGVVAELRQVRGHLVVPVIMDRDAPLRSDEYPDTVELTYVAELDEWEEFNRKLGAAVILRAVMDAKQPEGFNSTTARRFLQDPRSSLRFWCELAHMREDPIREFARRAFSTEPSVVIKPVRIQRARSRRPTRTAQTQATGAQAPEAWRACLARPRRKVLEGAAKRSAWERAVFCPDGALGGEAERVEGPDSEPSGAALHSGPCGIY